MSPKPDAATANAAATHKIALEIAADPSRANLERCLRQVRANQETLVRAQEQMARTLYEISRARETAEAVEESNRELEARIYLLLGALGR